MPLYEYQCEKCGQLFEVRQKFSDEPISTHENCGGHVNRLISAPSFQFKGSGWYVNDYGKKGQSTDNGSVAKDASGKSESTPSTASGEQVSGSKNDASNSKPTSEASSPKTKAT